MKKFRSDKQRRAWEKIEDRSTPSLRRLLDRLEEARPDMAPLKLSSDPTNNRMSLTTILYNPGYGYFGCYSVSMDWILKELKECRKRRREEYRQETLESIGAFI